MKVVIEFKDGLEMIAEMLENGMETVVVGRPDRPENVTVKFVGWSDKGHAIFSEIEAEP